MRTLWLVSACATLACAASAAEMELYPTHESVGLVVKADAAPMVEYRKAGEENAAWIAGHEMSPIGGGRFASSLLLLASGCEYEVRATIPADEASGRKEEVLTGKARTWDEKPPAPSGAKIAVKPGDPGGISAAIAKAKPGDAVTLADGDYYETVSFAVSGAPGKPVWLAAAGKKARILGCEERLAKPAHGADNWKPVEGAEGVFAVKLDHGVGFVAAKGKRLYHYESLDEVKALSHRCKDEKDYKLGPGWWQDGEKVLYVRLEPAADPDSVEMQVARFNNGIVIHDRSNVVIDGIEIAYFGDGQYGSAIDIRDSQNVVVQNCRIHHVRTGVSVCGQKAEAVTVQDCRLWDSSIDEWPWRCVKAHDIEGGAISFNGRRGLVARRNHISHFFNGVIASMWGRLEEEGWNSDLDVCRNRFWKVSDDPMEPEGTCINNRYYLNTTASCLQGISLAPVTKGPVYVFGNLFTSFSGGAFKVSNESAGFVYCYHNTCWSPREKQNGMESSGKWDNMHFRNNIISATRYAIEDYSPKKTATLDYDCLFTTAQGILVKWENARYNTLADLAAKGLEAHGVSADPQFVDAAGGDFRLKPGSPCVDKGARIAGLGLPAKGEAPDMGCFEQGAESGPPAIPAEAK